MNFQASRERLLEFAFSEIPGKIGDITLRPLSAGSFTLLGRLGNPMMVGGTAASEQTTLFEAVIQYIWVHSAQIEKVMCCLTADDIPMEEIQRLAFTITMGQALAFLEDYKSCAARMSASLAEVEEDEETPGKPAAPEPAPAGSPHSSSPTVLPETPPVSATSSGSSPSSDPSPTSTPLTEPTEPSADGLVLLPDLTTPTPETPA